jgi:predicted permease
MPELRQAIRQAVKRPGFTSVAVLTLALGIGATTSVFSLVSATLLGPLPVVRPDRLVFVASVDRTTGDELSVSYPDFLDWQEAAVVVGPLAAFGSETLILGGDAVERVAAELITDAYFQTLGVQPVIGRPPAGGAGRATEAIVSEALWRRRLDGAARVAGTTVSLNGVEFDVVGVAPAGFNGLTDEADVWVPMESFDLIHPALRQYGVLAARGTRWHSVVGRLAEGAALEGARREMETIADRLESAYPRANENKTVGVRAAREVLVGDVRTSLLVLFGAVGFVLLIACANLANLFLAAGASRHLEFAMRRALGAGRIRLVRQVLLESGVVAVLGGVGGLLVTAWAIPLMLQLSPVDLPSFVRPRIDARVLLFATLATALATVLFGLLPALRGSSTAPADAVHAEGRIGRSATVVRWQSLFVVGQVAGVFVLLIGAGLMLTSFQRVRGFDPGFTTENLLTMRLSLPESDPNADDALQRISEISEATRALPGIESVGVTSHLYFGQGYLTTRVVAEGQSLAPDEEGVRVYRQFVSPGYLEALGLPVASGRGVTPRDTASAPPIAVVSRSLARRLWPETDPVGRRFHFGRSDDAPLHEVVGVVSDVRPEVTRSARPIDPQVYTPMAQSAFGRATPGLLVRTAADLGATASPQRGAIGRVAPDVAVSEVATMAQLLAARTAVDRFSAWLMGLLGGLALGLATVGVTGVMGQVVARQTREIGVRLALGAPPRAIVASLVRHALRLTLLGLVIGWVGATLLASLLTDLLYGVSPTDPGVFVAVSIILAAAALAASYVPVRRASRIDPVDALRAE